MEHILFCDESQFFQAEEFVSQSGAELRGGPSNELSASLILHSRFPCCFVLCGICDLCSRCCFLAALCRFLGHRHWICWRCGSSTRLWEVSANGQVKQGRIVCFAVDSSRIHVVDSDGALFSLRRKPVLPSGRVCQSKWSTSGSEFICKGKYMHRVDNYVSMHLGRLRTYLQRKVYASRMTTT